MKLTKPQFEIWEQPAGLEGIYKQIERAGRVSYKSEDKITEDSAKPFVDRMINSGHGAVLEHGTVYLAIPKTTYAPEAVNTYQYNPYSVVHECDDFIFTDKYGDKVAAWCVTTNLRVLVEHNCLEDLEFLCEPTKYHAKRITVKFICDRGVSHEFVRHRVFSFLQESTRYCNYSKNKFGNEVTFIQPCWSCIKTANYNGVDNFDGDYFEHSLREAEAYYFELLRQGWTPQQARAVLPNALKTELVMTGFVDDWWGKYIVIDKATGLVDQIIHGKFYTELNNIDREKYRIVEKGFFPLRCSSNAHPQAQELAIPLRQEFIDKKIW